MLEPHAELYLLYNDITTPKKFQFYACQQQLIPLMEKYVRDVCRYEDQNNDRFYIRYEGSWSSGRNASHCPVDLIDQNGKIIDFEYMSRIECTHYRVDTSYYWAPSRVETLLVEKISGKWEDNPNLKGIVQDGDPKTKNF